MSTAEIVRRAREALRADLEAPPPLTLRGDDVERIVGSFELTAPVSASSHR